MTFSSRFTATERLTSLKAAALGGLCAGSVSLMLLGLHRVWVFGFTLISLDLLAGMANLTLLVNAAIATLSGALFALTYRYAVRQDNNVQLNAGVVLAFTLVRGLAQVDAGSAIAQNFWPFLSACGESFAIFGLTALLLTFATQRHWLTPFGQDKTP
ncbi:hypothetical protein PN498_01540 [Oscillatoria sp. CS-180]|uniref:hypothetical protein n=1 Tax=Oscillatoria sp. CS-180 TaxID=3021720 RepID=UPI0023315380|nr:hypothetical protein [Oscillatoria sp. CS-180]MDB9524657.1 hypothetical protein [Oscillatoria sp. CS-180]